VLKVDNTLKIIIINTLAIFIVGIVQYKLGYKYGYDKAVFVTKIKLDKMLEEMRQEYTVTSTED
jgi:hypothetical protein